jgi:hypothetical protein
MSEAHFKTIFWCGQHSQSDSANGRRTRQDAQPSFISFENMLPNILVTVNEPPSVKPGVWDNRN